MSLKKIIEDKTKNNIPLSRIENKFLELQEFIKTKGEDRVGEDYFIDLIMDIEWSDLEDAGFSSSKLEEMMIEQGIVIKK